MWPVTVSCRRSRLRSSRPRDDGAAVVSGKLMSVLQFAVEAKVVGNGRPPAIEGVLGGKVPRLPGAVLGDVVEVEEVLREAAPRVAVVVEEVRADHVAAHAPALRPP